MLATADVCRLDDAKELVDEGDGARGEAAFLLAVDAHDAVAVLAEGEALLLDPPPVVRRAVQSRARVLEDVAYEVVQLGRD